MKASSLALWPARASSALLLLAVVAAPLPFGSAGDSATAFWCLVLGLSVAAAPLDGLRKPHFMLLALAALVVTAYGVVLHEQLAARPWAALPHPLWEEAGEILGNRLEPSVSIARNEPFFALGTPLVSMLALACGFLSGIDRDRGRELLWIFACSAAAYAVYGVGAHLIDPTSVLWRAKTAYLTDLTATFINRNTAAAYFGTGAIVCLVLLCERVRRTQPAGPIEWRKVPDRLLSGAPRGVVVRFAMLFVCVTAMFMTRSRAGVVLSLMALIAAFTAYFHRDLPRRYGYAVAVLGGCAMALVLLQIMGGGVNARFDAQGAADEGRLATYRATLSMIADHPWFGTGQGSFAWIYPEYRPDDVSMWGIWDRAHNTLLEIAVDMGLGVAVLVASGWIVMFAVLLRGVSVRRRGLAVPAAALAVATLAALHSLVDFPLQIPGYAIPAFALIGAGLAQSFSARPQPARPGGGASIDRVPSGAKEAKVLG